MEPQLPVIELVESRWHELKSHLSVVPTEPIEGGKATGRILAEDLVAFRDSPSTDVSAMDGYAIRLQDLSARPLPVIGTATAGAPPQQLAPETAIRIFTGGSIPAGADIVIQREDCDELTDAVLVRRSVESYRLGQNIRFRGENARRADVVLHRGVEIQPVVLAGLATFSAPVEVPVHRRLRVAILNTGDELIPWGAPIEEWQIRDSNGPLLESMLARYRWAEFTRQRVADSFSEVSRAIESHLTNYDCILLTGGVSMGDTDFVPKAIESAGGKIVFHRIPIRPGKPLLGACTGRGQLIMGLPGNPQSVAVTFRRYALGLMQHMAGRHAKVDSPRVQVHCKDNKRLDLLWFRLVRFRDDGTVEVASNQGSGDLATLAQSDGFVEISPGEETRGYHPFFAW
jgi:molybdopterin molybdotransferase